ncbi:MAG TPA: 8-oxo-dGTP diphosphatase [Candidatus Paceibacterota bacterium]|nr:8-oxo-dGTP diphosphatase [Candidatus Paceibacterota bacterium]
MRIATLVLIIKDEQILLGLSKEGFCEGKVNAPGGKQEEGESLVDCAIREAREEAGVTIDASKLKEVAVITFYAGGVPHQEVHVFRTGSFTGEPRETACMVPQWYDVDDLPFDDMLEADSRWMPQAIRGRKFRTEVYYREPGKDFISIGSFTSL